MLKGVLRRPAYFRPVTIPRRCQFTLRGKKSRGERARTSAGTKSILGRCAAGNSFNAVERAATSHPGGRFVFVVRADPNTMYHALPMLPFDTIKANEHDGRSLTLVDTVEYFNLVLGLKMTQEEKGFARGVHADIVIPSALKSQASKHLERSFAMVDRMMFHAAQRRGAARFSASCFLATLMLVTTAPFVSAQSNSCGGDNGGITLPPGFCATIFADNLGHARQMAFGPNGVLYLNTWSGGYYQNDKPPDGGFLVALKDTKSDGRADMIERFGDGVAQGSAGGTGIRVYGHALFAEQNDKIIRYRLPADVIVPSERPHVVVSGLPLTGDHPMHPFIISEYGDLFVDLGSATNSCQEQNRIVDSPGYQPCIELQTRAGTWLYDALT
jgi:hypothetical protein